MSNPAAKAVATLVLLALVGCSISGEQARTGEALCRAHDGVKRFEPVFPASQWTSVVCNDDTQIIARNKK